ncbi:MAG TPA: protein-L-isoaspartate O-methyltransferase [Rhodospirillaceae bacterium]|nr:protein-L-isoaspartate O-methyltransferase [Rhodospirillaceae bacterium]HAT36443.1 protein-L-isoaspartate O-methyltransferase [Rhodospirillaceae bacterium]|tara:strand:+ start:179 stop:829 length:651 start_codon:yes stop_codon:yes gene_type:complete
MDTAEARRNMVDCQLRTNRVTDPAVLSAMGDLPREAFVPEDLRPLAYSDGELEVAEGRAMMAPMIAAKMFQSLEIASEDVVLVIGCASGYAAAVMGRMARVVFVLEDDPAISAKTGETCTSLGLDNVVPVSGPLREGWTKEAPYNAIFIDGAVEMVPEALCGQLVDGGRLVAVVVENGIGRATRYLKNASGQSGRVLFDAKAHLLSDFNQPQNFVF